MKIAIIVLLFLIPNSLMRALCGMWIFNWFAPVVYPGLHASYLQTLSAMALIETVCLFCRKHKTIKDMDEKEMLGRIFVSTFFMPFVYTGIMGVIYLGCVLPFK